jgi:hypothetical protein
MDTALTAFRNGHVRTAVLEYVYTLRVCTPYLENYYLNLDKLI